MRIASLSAATCLLAAVSCSCPPEDETEAVHYALTIPRDFDLAPPLTKEDEWLSSLVANLSERAKKPLLVYSVWRRTNIPCSMNGETATDSVFARDNDDNRFLVWTPDCAENHGGRPWLISWDHGMAYETDPEGTSFYLSPSGRYFVVISPTHYGATYAKGQLAPRVHPMRVGATRSIHFRVGDVQWESTLRMADDGERSATWRRF